METDKKISGRPPMQHNNAAFRQKSITIPILLILLMLTSCSRTVSVQTASNPSAAPDTALPSQQPVTQPDERAETLQASDQSTEAETGAKAITDICMYLYEQAANTNQTSDLETLRTIINRFGENGYPAVDSNNQIDMTEAGQVVSFCARAAAGEKAAVTIVEVTYSGGFVQYDLEADGRDMNVVRTYYQYENETMQKKAVGSYTADEWDYTEEGYLLFSGSLFSKEQYVLTMGESMQHTAFRVQPLDETYRELNRNYVLPIGYRYNNMFLTDWSEDDFKELNFYDMYDIFYPLINGRTVPYTLDANLANRAVYRIPKAVFEGVLMTYFQVNSQMLQAKTTYHAEDETYEYAPRGFYEIEYPAYPYPEVVGFTENEDKTMTLTVQAVFPYANDSKVYVHELTVRPLENGGVQYVSNHVIPSEDNGDTAWYTPRLTKEEWEEINGGT